nr:GNAT family N-acetyltransferase [Asticcacaulis currens]
MRPHILADFPAMCTMYSDPLFLRFVNAPPQTGEEVWNRLLRYMGHWAAFDRGLFAIVENDTGEFVGETGFANFHREISPDFDPFPEAAWALKSSAQGKGYAREAVRVAHAWFDKVYSERTVCIIDGANAPSQKIAAELGYRPFGVAGYKGKDVRMYQRTAVSKGSSK